jgi:hypothetical protein
VLDIRPGRVALSYFRTPERNKGDKREGLQPLSLLKNVIWLEIGSRVKIGMRIFINRMEHLVAGATWRLNPFGRHCIRTPRLQGGMTLDTEIGVSVRWPQEFTQPGARSDDAVHRPLGTR